MEIIAPKSGAQGEMKALIDSGCTCSLISLQTVQKLGLRMKRLCHPMKFKAMILGLSWLSK